MPLRLANVNIADSVTLMCLYVPCAKSPVFVLFAASIWHIRFSPSTVLKSLTRPHTRFRMWHRQESLYPLTVERANFPLIAGMDTLDRKNSFGEKRKAQRK